MTAFRPFPPRKAIEMVEAAGIPHAKRLIRDQAAAAMVRSYAMKIETIDHTGKSQCYRGYAVTSELWQRIVTEGVDDDVWIGGTVRLAAADFIGGVPAVNITEIGLNEADLRAMIERHGGVASAQAAKPVRGIAPPIVKHAAPVKPAKVRKTPDLSSLHSGALHLTVEQVKAALSIGHTSFYKLLNAGDLERAPSKAGTRITTASVRRYAGLAD